MDLDFNPADQVAGDNMNKAEHDDLAGMIDAIGGDDQPAVETSIMGGDGAPAEKPLS